MKRFFPIALVAALTATASLVCGEETKTAAPGASDIRTGSGIESRELTGASDSFQIAPDTRIYAVAHIRESGAVGIVKIVFKKAGKDVFSKELQAPSVPYRTNAFRTFRRGDDGDWSVALAGPDGKELASQSFKVEISK